MSPNSADSLPNKRVGRAIKRELLTRHSDETRHGGWGRSSRRATPGRCRRGRHRRRRRRGGRRGNARPWQALRIIWVLDGANCARDTRYIAPRLSASFSEVYSVQYSLVSPVQPMPPH